MHNMNREERLQSQLEQLDLLQSPCVNCGLCLEGCPTYKASGWEHESPRGRIRLARELMHGRVLPNSQALETFNACVGCNACEPLCPTSVKYSDLRETVQAIQSEWTVLQENQATRKIDFNRIKFVFLEIYAKVRNLLHIKS